jgi:hypothetical protein
MAFGKDNAQLGAMGGGFGRSTFGQQAATAATRPKSSGRRAPYWRNGFDISENPALKDTFRLIRGDYVQVAVDLEGNMFQDSYPFVMWREHFHAASKRGAICSGGPYYMDRNKREACNGCEMYWDDYKERKAKEARGDKSKGPNRLSMTDKFTFSLWSYAYYFEMPQTDANGQFRMNPKTNQPYTEWVKALNPQDPQFTGRQWKQGHLCPWSIGKTWKDTLVGWNVTIGQCCNVCSGRDCVVSRGWYCGNPNCRQLIFDPNNTTLTQEQQDQLSKKPYTCQHCQQKMYPHEEVWCHACAAANGGDGSMGKRASIFDVDLTGYRQRSGDGKQTNLIITSFSNPQPIQVADPEILKTIKPLDLLKQFAPTPPDEQARIWNLSPQAQTQQAPPPQAQTQQWAPPPGAPQGFVPPGGQPPAAYPNPQGYQGPPPVAQPAPPPAPQQPTPAAVDPNDISAQLAALNNQR